MKFRQVVVERPSEGNTYFGGDITYGSDKQASTKFPIGPLPVYCLLTVCQVLLCPVSYK